MRTAIVVAGLVLAGCTAAAPSARSSGTAATMKQRGAEILVFANGRTHYFEQRLPHCLAFTLDGLWDFAIQEAALRSSPDGRFVGVLVSKPEPDRARPYADRVALAVADIQRSTDKDWGPTPATVTPFPDAGPGALQLEFPEVTMTPQAAAQVYPGQGRRPEVGQRVRIFKKVVVPFKEELVMVITMSDPTDVRHVVDTLQVTEHPQCWAPTIRERFPGLMRGR